MPVATLLKMSEDETFIGDFSKYQAHINTFLREQNTQLGRGFLSDLAKGSQFINFQGSKLLQNSKTYGIREIVGLRHLS